MIQKLGGQTPVMGRLKVATLFGLVIAIWTATAAAQASRSVWDGVYTAEQAKKGEALAMAQCVTCHGDALRGGDVAPALTGDVFNVTWDGVTLVELADRIRVTMPFDNPGSLSRQQTSEVVAYVLSLSKIPAGAMPLSDDAAALGQIKFASYPPQK